MDDTSNAKEKFGGWDNNCSLQAAKLATKMRYDAIEKSQDLALETVFSSAEKIDFIHQAKQSGYFIRLFFVCTNSPEINAARVAKRMIQGGHEVPLNKIISRYAKSIANAKIATPIIDRLYLYDNSPTDQPPRLLSRFTDGKLSKNYQTNSDAVWANGFV